MSRRGGYRRRIVEIIAATVSNPQRMRLECGHFRYTSEMPADNPAEIGKRVRCRVCAEKVNRDTRPFPDSEAEHDICRRYGI